MSQCLSCQWAIMQNQPKGKCICFREATGTDKPLDVLEKRDCKLWKLGAMAQVHARSARRMKFDEAGNVRLE